MSFPAHIARVLDQYGVAADTKAALYDLYVALGDEVLEVFGDIADEARSVDSLTPDDTLGIRARVVERYVRRCHPLWREGQPTASLWHPRELQGRASGVAMPAGAVGEELAQVVRSVVGDGQPLPEGIVVIGKNAHYGGRNETISFDVVAASVDDAVALGMAAGQQHTLPGSAGETSGTLDAARNLALIWEIQPNVYKPLGERNRPIAKIYRRHRNWHVTTLAAALQWLRSKGIATYVLRGCALATAHEVNPLKPVSKTIEELHDRTVTGVVGACGGELAGLQGDDEARLLESIAMNHALRKFVEANGAAGAIWRVVWPRAVRV
ncbi:MAG TPA: hypothetical protein VNL91_03155 [Thermoanaerobaculia bacterium]|nr:hypothetical protein [Thermoanaerobaculia bacterium]